MSIVDYMQLFKKVFMREQSYTLNAIATKYLNEKETPEFRFGKLSQEVKTKNLRDVRCLVQLEEQFKLFSYFDEIRRLSKCQWEDFCVRLKGEAISGNSRIIEMLMFDEAKRQGVVLPNKPKGLEEEEEFKGAYRDVFQLGVHEGCAKLDLGCFSSDTKILTISGWKKYNELKINELVATYNIKLNCTEFQPLLFLHQYIVKNEKLIHIKNQYTDQLLTWNHKVLYQYTLDNNFSNRKVKSKNWLIRFAKDVPFHHTLLPVSSKCRRNRDYNISDSLLQLHAWIITEGWKQKNGNYYISQSYSAHPNYCREIDKSLKQSRLKFKRYKRVRKTGRVEYTWCIHRSDQHNIKLEENWKVIPLWMLQNLSCRQLELLYSTLMKGDGDKTRACYYAISSLARERFQYLCLLIGRMAYNNGRKEVYCRKLSFISISNNKKKYKNFSGVVWCPTVENGFVIVKRKERPFISGNSAYPSVILDFCLDSQNIMDSPGVNVTKVGDTYFKQNADTLIPSVVRRILKLKDEQKQVVKANPHDKFEQIQYEAVKAIINSSYGVIGNRHFRLYDRRVAAATAFLVREVLQYVRTGLEKTGHQVLYVDTDSVITNTPKDITTVCNKLVQQWAKEVYKKEKISLNFAYEGYFEKLLLLKKCRYFGYLNTGIGIKEEIKGLEVKRADSSKFMAHFQRELIDKILNKTPKSSIIKWISGEADRIKTLPLEEVGFPCKVSKELNDYKTTPIFLRALQYANELDVLKKVRGELFYYTYIIPTHYGTSGREEWYLEERTERVLKSGQTKVGSRKVKLSKNALANLSDEDKARVHTRTVDVKKPKDVIAFDKFTQGHVDQVDWSRMIERNIQNKVEALFEALGWEKEVETVIQSLAAKKEFVNAS